MEEQSVHSSISDINSEEAVRSERKFTNILIFSIVINNWYMYVVNSYVYQRCYYELTLLHSLSKLTPRCLSYICHSFWFIDKSKYRIIYFSIIYFYIIFWILRGRNVNVFLQNWPWLILQNYVRNEQFVKSKFLYELSYNSLYTCFEFTLSLIFIFVSF